ncbi:reverse transcriptase, partial [Necator americanus]
AKREAKKAVAKAKSDRYKAVYDMLDTREGERAVYRLVRARHRSTLDMEHTKIVKGADGAVLRRSGQILERWREYYNHLCNEEFCHPPIPTVPSVEGPVLPITAVEVSAALAKIKSNKATGPDDIPADVWKLLGDRGSMWLATLFNKIVAEGRTPDVWQTSVTVPVWKGKGDIADCTSYRPIRLLCHTMKVLERVLEARLRKIVSVSLNQCGFVKDCSTIDAIHVVRILLEKHREKNRSVHLTFLDLEKAFDRVPHELLWMPMRSHRVPEEYVWWTKLLYAKPTSVVRCAVGTSRPFPVQVGVHQGSSLSSLLFILCMDTITKEIQKQHPWTLLFADDFMLAAESRDDLQKQVQSWKDQLQQYGLRLNTSKTEYMECGPRIEDGSIRVDGTELNKLCANCLCCHDHIHIDDCICKKFVRARD